MNIDFQKTGGLIPAIMQHAETGAVLMLGYMNAEAFGKTMSEGRVTLFSRSKARLWTKGETSGNYLKVVDIKTDCDKDAVLVSVFPEGPTCHTGQISCFGDVKSYSGFLPKLERIIEQRKTSGDEGSYVRSLFAKGIGKIAQKVGEEAVELIIEAKDHNRDLFLEEAADLLFHYLLLLNARETSLEEVEAVLKKRNASRI